MSEFSALKINPPDTITVGEWNGMIDNFSHWLDDIKTNGFEIDNLQPGKLIKIEGDGDEIHTEAKLEVKSNIAMNGPAPLKISTNHGYVTIGATDGAFTHFKTNQIGFNFNKGLHIKTGEISATNGILKLKAGIVPHLTINNAGNKGYVGIGTVEPKAKLHVEWFPGDPNEGTLILGPTNSSHLRLGYHHHYSWIQSHGSKPLAINPIGNNVGIGTTDPKAKLSINGGPRWTSAGWKKALKLERANAIHFDTSSTIRFGLGATSWGGDSNNDKLFIFTTTSNDGESPDDYAYRFIMDKDGNIRIKGSLIVEGKIKATGGIEFKGTGSYKHPVTGTKIALKDIEVE